ncbi:hypothetical protein Mgra_00008331 [Meloidogyne graminicola]|uniref:Uncharacterized protein n=1 Tax=Meloidogyne graminicola TaxID=189291 RepID=A0A8S9ZG43_9BILA|nr:hypothetical protein Mgra_00008331 [Meloidogyne graminicola]
MSDSGASSVDEVDFHLVGPMEVWEFFRDVQAGGLRITQLQLAGTGTVHIDIWSEGEVIFNDSVPVEEWLQQCALDFNRQRVAFRNRPVSPALENRKIKLQAKVIGNAVCSSSRFHFELSTKLKDREFDIKFDKSNYIRGQVNKRGTIQYNDILKFNLLRILMVNSVVVDNIL